MKRRLQIAALVLTGTSLVILLAAHLYLKHTMGFYFPFGRLGVFTTLWVAGGLAALGCALGTVLIMESQSRSWITVASAALSLVLLLLVLFYMTPRCRWAFPEHLPLGSWDDPAADFQQAMRTLDRRKVILTNHLGFEQSGWESEMRVVPKVILSEEQLEVMQTSMARTVYAKATNYATVYNRLLQKHLEKGD
jgi:hypothetical protein